MKIYLNINLYLIKHLILKNKSEFNSAYIIKLN